MPQLKALYATEDGTPISTQSMIKTFRHCPKQADYKYFQRLKPKVLGKPLREGDWGHKCLESFYKDEDWRATHTALTGRFEELFDEEKDEVGDMPTNMERILKGYFWHYQNETWKVHDVEILIEVELPDGSIFRLKADLLVEDQYGLWLVDHKFNASIPNWDFRILDLQGAIYVWAALKAGYDVNGFIWNYIKRKAPTKPKLVKAGDRLYAKEIETDFRTLSLAIKEYGLNPAPYRPWLERLRAQRFVHGAMQTSPFYRRTVFERDNAVLKEFATAMFRTHKRMHSYDFGAPGVERIADTSCQYRCSYKNICTLEAMGGDSRELRKRYFEQVDPLYYYEDDPRLEIVRGAE